MKRTEIIKYSIIAVLGIAVIVLLISLFTKKKSDDNYKEVIKAKDETIKAIQRERDAYIEIKAEYKKQDSLLQLILLENKNKLKANDKKLKDIPVTVTNLSKEELRRAIIEY
jgi:hypothetical protein